MKRRLLLERMLLIDVMILIAAGFVAFSTVKVCLVPEPPRLTPEQITRDSLRIVEILARDTKINPYDSRLDSMPEGCIRLDVDRSFSHGREFNDSNYLHLEAARELGIEPIDDDLTAWDIHRRVVPVRSCAEYYVDELRHSLPYLVPEAEWLLRDIGAAFKDSLAARGGGDYRVKVTSVLRTGSSIRRLRRRNGNAVNRSAHLFGTTFDLSYSNFACNSDSLPRTTDDLRLLLAEVLKNFRDQGRCYIKHERKQSCFHITVRPVQSTNFDYSSS